MLILDRPEGTRIVIGDDVIITVVKCGSGRVKLGFDAPEDVAIHREEVYRRLYPPKQK